MLIVDDQSGVRRVARGYLEAAGYPVVEAHGASSALAMAGEDREGIGAALIDLTMPGTSGYEVALNLRRRLPGLPIVIMSGFDRHDSLGEHPPKEELPFLQKPFTQSQLLDALARAIESRR